MELGQPPNPYRRDGGTTYIFPKNVSFYERHAYFLLSGLFIADRLYLSLESSGLFCFKSQLKGHQMLNSSSPNISPGVVRAVIPMRLGVVL